MLAGDSPAENKIESVNVPIEATNVEVVPVPLNEKKPEESLHKFLARPVDIFTGFINGLPPSLPWSSFLVNDAVQTKLAHYRHIRGTLCIRVNVQCPQTVYGLYRVAAFYGGFMPYDCPSNKTTMSTCMGDWLALPEKSYVELRIPYFDQYPYIDITTNKGTEAVGLRIQRYTQAKNALTEDDYNPRVRITAWVEDVELSVPTSALGTAESNVKANDEYGKGPVSRVASAVAGSASALSNVPVIGPYARATEIGAKAFGAIASIFGFSRPMVLDDPTPYYPGRNISMTDAGFPGIKFSVDPKQETALATGMAGPDDKDPMAIAPIAARDCWLCSSTWNGTYSSGYIFHGIPVTPTLATGDTWGGAIRGYQPTPMGEMALLFDWWRGDIVYTIMVASSRYHAGLLRIFWAPEKLTVPSTEGGLANLVDSVIIDISKNRSVELRVPFRSRYPYLRTAVVYPDDTAPPAGQSWNEYYNGWIYFQVVEPLVGPSTVSPQIEFHTIARMENAEFGRPTRRWINNLHGRSSEVNDFALTVTYHPDLATHVPEPSDAVFAGSSFPYGIYESNVQLHMGEQVGSLRSLIKRPQLYCTYRTGTGVEAAGLPGLPIDGLIYKTSENASAAPAVEVTLHQYLRRSFAGCRGGSRWFVDLRHCVQAAQAAPVPNQQKVYFAYAPIEHYFQHKNYAFQNMGFAFDEYQPAVPCEGMFSVELPWQNAALFIPGKISSNWEVDKRGVVAILANMPNGIKDAIFYWAGAEDFTYLNYQFPSMKFHYRFHARITGAPVAKPEPWGGPS
jgi:hypothetical protein